MSARNAVGASVPRREAHAKVTGTATYAFEHPVRDPLYASVVQSTVVCGTVVSVDAAEARAVDGVVEVLDHTNAPRLKAGDDRELAVLQTAEVEFRGQVVAVVLAETPEAARRASGLVQVSYDERPGELRLDAEAPSLYAPSTVNAGYETDTDEGNLDKAMRKAVVSVDQTYRTPLMHNNALEPHTTIAQWEHDKLTLYDSTQGVHPVRNTVAPLLGLDPEDVNVIAPHVGGGFGSKGTVHAHVVVAALAAQAVPGRAVKLALTRQQTFALGGHRAPTIQRIQLAADADGHLTGIGHHTVTHTSTVKEFAEQASTVSRTLYAAPSRRTGHRLVPLNVPVPSWMRAPGVCPGTYALEVAMDELAVACGIDPIELRIANEPDVDPETGLPYSSRNLVACLREGAERFGWDRRARTPGPHRVGDRLVGMGVAASTYPVHQQPGSSACIRALPGGRFRVEIGAADLGTGTWTVLGQIAADALDVGYDDVEVAIGNSGLPPATVAGGSSGVISWGSTIVAAARRLRDEYGGDVPEGAAVTVETPDNPASEEYAMHAFGAQFAEVSVDADTGEILVPRLLGVFAAGRIVNPRTARSQFVGGMTMGLSMALHEEGVLDTHLGHVVNHDLAGYHVASHADVLDLDATWLDEDDPHVNPMGAKGIGEIGVVGTAAAVANAVHHATGVRLRSLPLRCDDLVR